MIRLIVLYVNARRQELVLLIDDDRGNRLTNHESRHSPEEKEKPDKSYCNITFSQNEKVLYHTVHFALILTNQSFLVNQIEQD